MPTILIGAGGHAKVLHAALVRLGAKILGVVNSDLEKGVDRLEDVPFLGDDAAIATHNPETIRLVNGIGSIRSTAARRAVYEKFVGLGYSFATIVDPLAIVAGHVRLGSGAQLLAGSIVQAGVSLGANCIVNTGASVDHDCFIGEHVHVSPGAILSGDIRIGARAHVGTAATIIQGLTIGDDVLIAAGAVVTEDVSSGATVAGVPARLLSSSQNSGHANG